MRSPLWIMTCSFFSSWASRQELAVYLTGRLCDLPCLGIPGISSKVRVRSEGLQNAYDSTRASKPILNGRIGMGMDKRSCVRSIGAFLRNKQLRKQRRWGLWQVRSLAQAERNASEMGYHSVTRAQEDDHPRSLVKVRQLSRPWRIKGYPLGLSWGEERPS